MKYLYLLVVFGSILLTSCVSSTVQPPSFNAIRNLKLGMNYNHVCSKMNVPVAHEFGIELEERKYHIMILQMTTGIIEETHSTTEVTYVDSDGNERGGYTYSNIIQAVLLGMLTGGGCDDCESESYTESVTETYYDVTEYFLVFEDDKLLNFGYLYEFKRDDDELMNLLGKLMEEYIR
jgi:hypothetical protein